MELNINEELRELIPPLQIEEKNLLEKSILEEGCRDSIVIWEGTIIDGHNRYGICKEYDIPFTTKSIEFESLGKVKQWMINNQLARRNLTDSQRRYFIGKRYEEDKKQVNEFKGNQYTESATGNSCQHQNKEYTSQKIAKENNISERTVRNNEDYSKAIDKIKEKEPDIANKILTEEIKLNNKEVLEIAETEETQRKEVFEEMAKGTPYKEVKKVHVTNNSGNNEWYTPSKFIEIARKVMGSIDTDPASSEFANKSIQAETIYTIEDSGLEKEWFGNVWMNPPYSQPEIQEFSNKLIEQIEEGNTKQAMVLVNNATETRWFNTLSSKAKAIWFMKGRVKFLDSEGKPGNSPLQGQAILYFGDNVEGFIENCEGLVCRCIYE